MHIPPRLYGPSAARVFGPLVLAIGAGCSGADDPLGGPYGGNGDFVAPNGGNVSASGDVDAAAGDGSAATGSSASSSSASGSGSGSSAGAASGSSRGSGSSSGGGSGGVVDAGNPTPAAPTWSHLFTTYLANGTPGGCPRCHGQMSSASSAYSWLKGQRYIRGASSLLASASGSCLTWYGGNMPPGGSRSNAAAVSEMSAWAAAGAPNN